MCGVGVTVESDTNITNELRILKNMTSYANEEDFLRDQLHSNNIAVKFIKRELHKDRSEFQEDQIGTKNKVVNVYTQGLEALKEDSEHKSERIRLLDHDQ